MYKDWVSYDIFKEVSLHEPICNHQTKELCKKYESNNSGYKIYVIEAAF